MKNKFKIKKNTFFNIFWALLLFFYFVGCSGSASQNNDNGVVIPSANSDNSVNEAGSDSLLTAAVISEVKGQVSSKIVTSDSDLDSSTLLKMARSQQGCESCSSYGIGIGALKMDGDNPATCGVDANGSFTASVHKSHEAMVAFSGCSNGHDIRCFTQPGIEGLVCDPLADAMVSALEQSLEESVATSSLYRDLKISTIAQGMIETLKLVSRIDPSSSILEQIEAAAGDKSKLLAIINESPVGAVFSTLANLAKQKKAENEALLAGKNADDAKYQAMVDNWTIESLIDTMVSMGAQIDTMIGSENDGFSFYSPAFQAIGGQFAQDFNEYLMTLLETIESGESSKVKMACQAQPHDYQKKAVRFMPVSDQNKLVCDYQGKGINPDEYDILGLILFPANIEKDRNDPEGKQSDQNNISKINHLTISAIDIFDEFDEKFESYLAKTGSSCGFGGQDGNLIDSEAFLECFEESGADAYIAGLFGIYRFLTNIEISQKKFSLKEIHSVFADNIRIVGETHFFNGSEVRVVDMVDSSGFVHEESFWMPMILSDRSEGGLLLECPDFMCDDQDQPIWGQSVSSADIVSYMDETSPGYEATFKVFENIPSLEAIKNIIFTSAHHEDFNLAGPKSIHILGISGQEDKWQAIAPILCQIKDGSHSGEFRPGQSSLQCQGADDVNWLDGKVQEGSDGYGSYSKGWYGLEWRSHPNESEQFFALIDLRNRVEVELGGKTLRIKNEATGDGKTIRKMDKEFCDSWANEKGEYEQHCWHEFFNYVSVDLSPYEQSDDFQPYASFREIKIEETMDDGSINISNQGRDILISRNGTEKWNDEIPVCIRKEGVITEAQSGGDERKYISLQPKGNMVNCDQAEQDFYYFLVDWGNGNTLESYKLILVSNNGVQLHSGNQDDPFAYRVVTLSEIFEASKALCSIEADCSQPGLHLAPVKAATFIPGYSIANLRYDGKFDPFCDDLDNSGHCDCQEYLSGSGQDAQCTIDNLAGNEPTFTPEDLPYWPGDRQQGQLEMIVKACGNLTSKNINDQYIGDCLLEQGLKHENLWEFGDVTRLFACENNKELKGLQIYEILDPNAEQNARVNAGHGCGFVNPFDPNQQDEWGPVRLRKFVARKNAYDVARPRTLMQLVTMATASVGTNVTIGDDEPAFTFPEALALVMARLSWPVNETVYQANGDALPEISIWYQPVRKPGSDSDVVKNMLEAFMLQAKMIP